MANPVPSQVPIEAFFSYSHKDEEWRNELEEHLALMKRQGIITTWHDRQITAGAEWSDEIDGRLESSRLILLLVSSSFLASDYCYGKEMTRALERHSRGEALVIPVIVREVDWQSAPFAKIQSLPRDAKAVNSWPNRDAAWTEVARGIRRAIHEFTCRLAAEQKKLPTGAARSETTAARPSSGLSAGVTAALDPVRVKKATRALRTIMGPCADVIVEQKAARARNVFHLYRLLAAEIPSDEDREEFLRVVQTL